VALAATDGENRAARDAARPGRSAPRRVGSRWWPFALRRPGVDAGASRTECRASTWIRRDPSRAATGQASALSRASSTDLGGSRLSAAASGSAVRNRKARLRAGRSPPPAGAAGRRIALEALRFRAVNASRDARRFDAVARVGGEPKAKNLRPIRYSRRVIPVGARAKSCSRARRPMTLCRAARIENRSPRPPLYLLTIIAAWALLNSEVRKRECRALKGS
jgi:hypothetical protein